MALQLEGTPYHSPKLHPLPRSGVGMRRGTDRQTQTAVTTIHFASSTTNAKCNEITRAHTSTNYKLQVRNRKIFAKSLKFSCGNNVQLQDNICYRIGLTAKKV